MSSGASWISTRGLVTAGLRLLAATSDAYAAPSNPPKPVSALTTVLKGSIFLRTNVAPLGCFSTTPRVSKNWIACLTVLRDAPYAAPRSASDGRRWPASSSPDWIFPLGQQRWLGTSARLPMSLLRLSNHFK